MTAQASFAGLAIAFMKSRGKHSDFSTFAALIPLGSG